MSKPLTPDRQQTIADRIRGMARIWTVLVWAMALILLFGPRAEGALPAQGGNAIPALLLVSLVGLGIAWKREIWGAALNLGAYLTIVPAFYLQHGEFLPISILIALSPVIFPGVLYAIAWGMGKR